MGHEVPDVPGLHAAAVLDTHCLRDVLRVDLRERVPDEADDLAGVRGLGVAPGADGPDRLVRDDEGPGLLLGEAGQAGPHLARHLLLGPVRLPLLQRLPHAHDRGHAVGDDSLGLPRHVVVGLAEQLPALGVAHDDVLDLERGQHARRHLSGEGPLRLPVDVLGPEREGQPVGLDQRLDAPERGERRAHHDLDRLGILGPDQVPELLDGLDRLEVRLVHLPVRRDDRPPFAHAAS